MKKNIAFVLCIFGTTFCLAQAANYKPNPKAKALDDSAVRVFTRSNGVPDSLAKVGKLLEDALKIDPQYYEGWSNLLSFQGRTDHFDKAIITAKKTAELFPDNPQANFDYAVLLYVTGDTVSAKVSFNKVLKLYEDLQEKNKGNASAYKAILTQKGILLILLDREREGKKILRDLHDKETEDYIKSYLAFYINSDKVTIIRDKIPGK